MGKLLLLDCGETQPTQLTGLVVVPGLVKDIVLALAERLEEAKALMVQVLQVILARPTQVVVAVAD